MWGGGGGAKMALMHEVLCNVDKTMAPLNFSDLEQVTVSLWALKSLFSVFGAM